MDNKWHHDTLPYRASTRVPKQMRHLQPWDKEIGNGHGMTSALPTWEAAEQIESIPPGVTNIPHTGTTPHNRHEYVERAVHLIEKHEEISKTKKMRPLKYWIIIDTKQGILLQWGLRAVIPLHGRRVMKLMIKKADAILYDSYGHLHV